MVIPDIRTGLPLAETPDDLPDASSWPTIRNTTLSSAPNELHADPFDKKMRANREGGKQALLGGQSSILFYCGLPRWGSNR
jgi:hypothetical protein